jgi:hypothetical protein
MGASVDLALEPHDFARRVRSLNVAALEALERDAARRSVVPTMNVRSSGVAIQRSQRRAAEASRRELAERDVVLLHTYCHVPPASRFRFGRDAWPSGEAGEDIRVLSALSQELDELSVFLLQSVYPELDVIVAVVRTDAHVGIGFAAGPPRQTRTLTKAVTEALCIAKAFAIPTTAAVLAEARACGFRDETVETFAARAEALGVPAAELQCGILLAELERGDCLRFLYEAPVAPSIEALLTSRTPCLDETGAPVRPATIQNTPIASMLGGLLHVCQATSANAFLLGWPAVPFAEIKRVATLRRVASRLGENARLPCIVA